MIAVAIALEAAKENIGPIKAGFRLAWHQLLHDEADGMPAAERRRRFDEVAEATRQLQREQ